MFPFSHCGIVLDRFLDVAYRMQLVLAELVGFNADIICCQEVDAKVYNDYMQPLLSQKGRYLYSYTIMYLLS